MGDLERVFEGIPIPSNPCIVSYDVDSIKSYIFAPDEFQAIIGGSVLVRRFDEEIAERLGNRAVKVYTGGGSGMFLTDEEHLEEIKEEIKSAFESYVPGATITVVSETFKKLLEFFESPSNPVTSDFELFEDKTPTFHGVFSYMASKMGREKKDKLRQSEVLVESQREPCEICGVGKPINGDVCKACTEKENAVASLRFGKSEGLFGSLWKDMSLNLDAIATKTGEGQRGWIGVIYGDGNNLGKVYEKMKTAKEYIEFSEKLEETIISTIKDVVENESLSKHFAAPILGGDDLMLLVPANKVFNVLERLVKNFEQNVFLSQKEITFSFGAAVMPSTLPIRFSFELAQKLLKSAKESSYRHNRKGFHVAYRFIEMGVFKPKNDFKIHEGIRASLGHGMRYPEFEELLKEVKTLKSARKRNLLYKLLTTLESDPAEAKINTYYFCARDDYFKDRNIRKFVDKWVLSKNGGSDFITHIPTMLEMWDFVGEG